MKFYFFLFFLSLFNTTFSQQTSPSLISTSGESYSNSSAILYYSIGEISIETYINTNDTLTQGFHQDILKTENPIYLSELNEEITIYPNPVSSKFTLELEEKSSIEIKMFDIAGHFLFSDKLHNQKSKEFNIDYLSPGIYFMNIIFGNKKLIYKIEKIK